MNDIFSVASALITGLLLGAMFFGGLWWTVRKGMTSTRPALWFFSSLLLRTVITLAGLYVVSDGHWERLLAGLVGFTIARPIVTRITGLTEKPPSLSQEAGHAP